MTLIKSPHELCFTRPVKCMIYGQSGIGKTTLALSTPNSLLLSLDGSHTRTDYSNLIGAKIAVIENYSDLLEVLKENLSEFDTLIIDTVGKLLDLIGIYIGEKSKLYLQHDGTLTQKGYGAKKAEFQRITTLLFTLKKNLIFTAHIQEKTEGKDTVRNVPLIGGSSYDILIPDLDLIGYLFFIGGKRHITFNPSDTNDGKNICELEPLIKLPDTNYKNNYMEEKIFNKYFDKIKSIENIINKQNDIIENIKLLILACENDTHLNDIIENINITNNLGNRRTEIGLILNNRAKELGFKYNKNKKIYEPI